MIATTIIESVLCILLLGACIYGIQLSRRLQKMKLAQEDLISMIAKFDIAAQTAQKNLDGMQSYNDDLERKLKRLVGQANGLISELSVMVNAGDNIAERLEDAVDQVRGFGTKPHNSKPTNSQQLKM